MIAKERQTDGVLQRQRREGGRVADRIDTRSIADINPDDLRGHTRCHFFAGIGGWEYALRLAGWPADAPVWTGSCPCQPFSQAGKQRGVEDERHVWPLWRDLIEQCRPPVIFGEQVASKAGRAWLAGVRADLEALGYGVGAADLCAACVGAPHIRQRLYWVGERMELADSDGRRGPRVSIGWAPEVAGPSEAGGLPHSNDQRHGIVGNGQAGVGEPERDCEPPLGLQHSAGAGRQAVGTIEAGLAHRDALGGAWGTATVECRDGKTRRLEPGIEPLAYGVPARVVRLRGYGNAIVPQLAAEFVMAYMEASR